MKVHELLPLAAFFLAACGGGDAPAPGTDATDAPAAEPAASGGATAPTGPLTIPDWYAVDNDARTVSMTIVAGETSANNYWNYNGAISGELTITVPEGYTVNIEFINQDPNMAHSLGISTELSDFAVPPAPDPVFPGAITENPQSMVDGTMPGETETVTFVAETAGNYSLVCYVPGHTAVGMWLFFNVSESGEAGVQGL